MGGIERSGRDTHNRSVATSISHDQLRRRQAENYLDQSSFSLLAEDLRKVVEDLQINRIPRNETAGKIGNAGIELRWDHQETEKHDVYGYKSIWIFCDPDGKIQVTGNWLLGSTTLSLKKWKENKEIQRKALDKAFKHPRYLFISNPR